MIGIATNPSSSPAAFHAWLRAECGYQVIVAIPGGRWAGIQRLLFHWTMHVGSDFDFAGHDERYCYRSLAMAADALTKWALQAFAGEPGGWHKAPYTGRIRPEGDPNREHLEWEMQR